MSGNGKNLVINVALLVLRCAIGNSLPPCHDPGVLFESEPRDIVSFCRANEIATFSCRYTGSSAHPLWMINDTVYSSLNSYLPPDHSYNQYDRELTVTNLRSKNGSVYQCLLISSEQCVYPSTVAQLKCEDTKVRCSPYYHYESPILNNLMAINTTITKGDNSERIYNVTYMDSDSGSRCDSVKLSCGREGACYHMFNTSLSLCSIMSNITVIVSAITDVINPMPDPIRIDAINNFVRISITPGSFSCVFIDQSEETEKFCAITYGPVTPGCNNLTFYLESTSDSSNIEIQLSHDSPADSNICFVVIAGNGTTNVTVEGKSSASCTGHHTSESTMAAAFAFTFYLYHKLLYAN